MSKYPPKQGYVSCYTSHKPLVLGDYQVTGGSCYYPVEADIYINLDKPYYPEKGHFPWEGKHRVYFPIVDQSVPRSLKEFEALIDWIETQLKSGKKVHVGCIGGHGRTGLVLSVLVNKMLGVKDAITHVRTHYCPKAVESKAQVDWLNKHFGITKVLVTKKAYTPYKQKSFRDLVEYDDDLLVLETGRSKQPEIDRLYPVAGKSIWTEYNLTK